MICSDANLRAILQDERDAAGYSDALDHVETCEACRRRLDASFDRDAECGEIREALSGAGAEIDTYEDPATAPHGALPRDRAAETLAAMGIMLDTGSHPELLGRIGRYDVERVVGVGGMGVVLKAYDGELHRVVALKLLARHLTHGAAARQRFAREARAAAAVHHPNVLPIYNVEASGDQPYLVMQYVAGESLQGRVERCGALAIAEALRIAKQTAAALAAAHEQGLIHRDVKPANILLEDNTDRAVLSDFGLARTADDAALTRTGIVAGTPQYMSPEQANGETIDDRSDLFSLGCVLYFMLAGRPPFSGSSAVSVLHRICKFPHEPLQRVNPAVPREVSKLVDRLLAKQASHRFADAAAVVHRVDSLLSNLQNGNLRLPSNPAWRRRVASVCGLPRWRLAAAGAVAGVFFAATLWSDPFGPSGDRQEAAVPQTAEIVERFGSADATNALAGSTPDEPRADGETSFAFLIGALPPELRAGVPHSHLIDELDRLSQDLEVAETDGQLIRSLAASILAADAANLGGGQATPAHSSP